ncbi:MAG: 3-deoxy-D-manno-octulosonic acid transferase [Candidatus Zixiibacteriota bacterium]
MYTFYNLLLNLAFVVSFPYLLFRAALGKHGVKERMGILPIKRTEDSSLRKIIWFHAASVGEVKALSTIIPRVSQEHPEYGMVVSTVTKSGKKEAENTLKGVKLIFYLPVDLKRFMRRALNRIRPVALILVETELWPNLIREAKKKGCFVAAINGRISDRSLRKYLWVKGLFSETLSCFDLLCMQSEEHKKKMILLGADAGKIAVTGNLKFDRLLYSCDTTDKSDLRRKMSIPDDLKVIIGGSVRSGEEKTLIGVFKRLKQRNRCLFLVLAPRHLDRLGDVERILSDQGLRFIQKSKLDGPARELSQKATTSLADKDALLVDTMGELSELYALADVAFVGGSLVPVGGHNLLEPAICGVPVLFGPHVDHFKEEARILIESGGGIQVENEEDLYLNLSDLLSNDEKRMDLGRRAKEAVQKQTGASQRTIDLIFSSLERNTPEPCL